jgi:hypothetical protein
VSRAFAEHVTDAWWRCDTSGTDAPNGAWDCVERRHDPFELCGTVDGAHCGRSLQLTVAIACGRQATRGPCLVTADCGNAWGCAKAARLCQANEVLDVLPGVGYRLGGSSGRIRMQRTPQLQQDHRPQSSCTPQILLEPPPYVLLYVLFSIRTVCTYVPYCTRFISRIVVHGNRPGTADEREGPSTRLARGASSAPDSIRCAICSVRKSRRRPIRTLAAFSFSANSDEPRSVNLNPSGLRPNKPPS